MRGVRIPIFYCGMLQRRKSFILTLVLMLHCSAGLRVLLRFCKLPLLPFSGRSLISHLIMLQYIVRPFIHLNLLSYLHQSFLKQFLRAFPRLNFWKYILILVQNSLVILNPLIFFNNNINISSIEFLLCWLNHIVSQFNLIFQVLYVNILEFQCCIFSFLLLLILKFLDLVDWVLIAKT